LKNLILVLGDQLSFELSSLKKGNKKTDTVVMVEAVSEATYVPHHKQKLVLVFSAMRHFAEALRDAGWSVKYEALPKSADAKARENFTSTLKFLLAMKKYSDCESLIVTEPGEWRLRDEIDTWEKELSLPVELLPDDRFLCTTEEFANWADGRKQLRMEYFYREMRRKTGLLMDGDKPAGGKWNFDADNRKPAKADLFMPSPAEYAHDKITSDVIELVESRFADHFGTTENFFYGVTHKQAEAALDHFIEVALAQFGDFQDAMLEGEAFLYHSVLSVYINIGLLDPWTRAIAWLRPTGKATSRERRPGATVVRGKAGVKT